MFVRFANVLETYTERTLIKVNVKVRILRKFKEKYFLILKKYGPELQNFSQIMRKINEKRT